jgi:hypothetical protein
MSTQNMCLDKGYDFPSIDELVDERGYTGHIARTAVDQSKRKRIPWISREEVGRRVDPFVDESVQEAPHQVGGEEKELSCDAASSLRVNTWQAAGLPGGDAFGKSPGNSPLRKYTRYRFCISRRSCSSQVRMGVTRSSRTTVALTVLVVMLSIAAEITVLQAEETALAPAQLSTTAPSLFTSTTPGLYNVTFVLSSQCGGRPAGWDISQWGVTLGNMTKTYPLNANMSQIKSGDFSLFGSNQSASSIAFAVPDGEYTYQLYPSSLEVLAGPPDQQVSGATGVIRVAGSNAEFCLADITVVA